MPPIGHWRIGKGRGLAKAVRLGEGRGRRPAKGAAGGEGLGELVGVGVTCVDMRTPRVKAVVSRLALVLAVAMAIACGTSNVANDADVVVQGTLLYPDGSPAVAVTVGLLKEPGVVDALVELAATVSTVGLICLTQSVSICKGARKVTTGADGKYSFTMRGNDSKTMLGNPSGFLVSAAMPDNGPSVQTRFEITQAMVEVPATTFWQPASLEVAADRTNIRYSWTEIANVKKPAYATVISSGETEVWQQESGPSGQLDARVAEDVRGQFRAVATATVEGSGTKFTTAHHSQRKDLQAAAGPALSRGETCAVAGQSGPVAVSPCVLTDGNFGGQFPTQHCAPASPTPSPSSAPCPANTWVSVDLGASRQLSAVLLHGLHAGSEVIVESSSDGSQWTQRGKVKATSYVRLAFAPAQARHVRVRAADGTIYALRELSVW